MSDQDQVIIIESSKPFEQVSINQNQKQQVLCQMNEIWKVNIREFERKKQSFLSQEVQIYKIIIYKNNNQKQIINRRYSDFEFLFQILKQRYLGLILPGFPEKTVLSFVQAKFSVFEKQQFIEKRMLILERFLQKLLNMPFSKQSFEIQKFLGDQTQFQIFKKSTSHQIKKKNYINNALTTATSYFKTKKTDSKFDQILQNALLIQKQLENNYNQLVNYIQLNKQQIQLNQDLINASIKIPQQINLQKNFQVVQKVLLKQNNQIKKMLELIYYNILDMRKRYQLRQNNQNKLVQKLENTFQKQKDTFLNIIEEQNKAIRSKISSNILENRDQLTKNWK